jgi:hypothetical protein
MGLRSGNSCTTLSAKVVGGRPNKNKPSRPKQLRKKKVTELYILANHQEELAKGVGGR